MGKFKVGDKIMDSVNNEDTGTIIEILERNNLNYYKIKFFQNGAWRVSAFLPEFRIQHVQLNLF